MLKKAVVLFLIFTALFSVIRAEDVCIKLNDQLVIIKLPPKNGSGNDRGNSDDDDFDLDPIS